MIELQVPRDGVRIFETIKRRIEQKAWTFNRCDAIIRKCHYKKTLVLVESADVEWNLVVEQTHATTNDGALRTRRRNDKPETWRQVVVPADAVPIVAQPEIEHDA